MLAGLVTAPRTFELVEVPEPVAVAGAAVVDIHRCGICGTDLHGFLGPGPYHPAICGHEWVGTVRQLGAGVTNVAEGDRVVGAVAPPCGVCPECVAGRPGYCLPAFLGMIGRDPLAPPHGGFAPAIAVDARRLVPVLPSISDDDAAQVEPATVALHAVQRTLPHPGEAVVVQGCGPIGLMVLQCARALGAEHVVAVEPTEHRRALALQVGADEAIGPTEALDRFGRSGVDLVYECAGVPSTVQQAVGLVRRGGRVNLVGLASGTATIDPGSWLIKEVHVTASLGYQHHEFGQVIDLIADGAVRPGPLHDRTVSLAELPHTIAELAADPTTATKVLVDPTS